MRYIVSRILEPDYGCEERPDDYIAMDRVILRDAEGQEISMWIPDKELYDKNINEGDRVCVDEDNQIYKDE